MCGICGQNTCLPSCPNYEENDRLIRCDYCGQFIYPGSFYVNSEDIYVHRDCLTDMSVREMLEFLEIPIKMMEAE